MIVIFNKNKNSASTRIRGHIFTEGVKAPAMYIQKKATEDVVRIAQKYKGSIIYDLDDKIREKKSKQRETMLKLATVVTTDTEERAKEIRKFNENVYVVPDCVDYLKNPPTPKKVIKVKNIVTFGNKLSVLQAEGWVTHYICNKRVIAGKFIPWDRKTFIDNLRKFDLCVLRHKKNSSKGNLRLITAMAAGVPCVVSDTPSFADTMKDAGYKELIVDNKEDLPKAIRFIESHPNISEDFINFAWENYSPEKSQKIFRKVIYEHCLSNR